MAHVAASLARRFPGRTTATDYVSDLRIFVAWFHQPLTAATSADSDRFVDAQQAQGLRPATVKRRVAALRNFFSLLAETLGEPTRPNPVVPQRDAASNPANCRTTCVRPRWPASWRC